MASTQSLANSNGNVVRPLRIDGEEKEENIFLFYPNLIGMHPSLQFRTFN
jgi:hypothetical protein